jgi:hypothetical protein
MPDPSRDANATTCTWIERLRRARGAPLSLGPSASELLARELPLPEAERIPHALRSAADLLIGVQRRAAEAGAELLFAPTAATSAAALRATGYAYRAAALTGTAVELTREAARACATRGAAPRVLGEIVLDGPQGRATAEAPTHLERLALAGVDAIVIETSALADAAELLELAEAHAMPALVRVRGPVEGPVPRACAAVIVEAAADQIVGTVEHLRRTSGVRHFGALVSISADDDASAQLAALAAWGALASLDLDLLGARGLAPGHALAAARALRELSRGVG